MTTEKRTSCLEAWPECQNGSYNPACCRFPKSCSCEYVVKADITPGAVSETYVTDEPRTYLHGDEEREAFRQKLREMRAGSMPAYLGPKAGRDR